MATPMGVVGNPTAGIDPGQLQALLAKDQKCEATRSMGLLTEAIILNVADLVIPIGDGAVMRELELEVRPTDRPTFRAETENAISRASTDRCQSGKTIWVKFNPNDVTQVALDHA